MPVLAACSSDGTAEPDATVAEPVATADVPEGGGLIDDGAKVVYVQPAAGEYKAYSAVCPHQKCVFTIVEDNTIKCGGCHQSEFDAATGKNTVGPNGSEANLPSLEEVPVTVDGDQISLA